MLHLTFLAMKTRTKNRANVAETPAAVVVLCGGE